MNVIDLIRESNDMLLVALFVFAFAGHDWLAENVGKTVAAAVGIALIVAAGIGIRDDVADVFATDTSTA